MILIYNQSYITNLNSGITGITTPTRKVSSSFSSIIIRVNLCFYVFKHNRFKISGFIINFALADRFADHASRERFSEPTPGLGSSEEGCSEHT